MSPTPQSFHFEDDGAFPNSPLPVLVYHEVPEAGDARRCERLFAENDWRGAWQNGIYSFHLFHSIAHEVLGVVAGSATVILGGPNGRELEINCGDVLVLPAGTGHCNLDDRRLRVVGAYPNGMKWDICRGDPDEHDEAASRIRSVPLPTKDPVGGASGSLLSLWSSDTPAPERGHADCLRTEPPVGTPRSPQDSSAGPPRGSSPSQQRDRRTTTSSDDPVVAEAIAREMKVRHRKRSSRPTGRSLEVDSSTVGGAITTVRAGVVTEPARSDRRAPGGARPKQVRAAAWVGFR